MDMSISASIVITTKNRKDDNGPSDAADDDAKKLSPDASHPPA